MAFYLLHNYMDFISIELITYITVLLEKIRNKIKESSPFEFKI